MRPPFRRNPGYNPRKSDGLLRGFGWFVVPEWDIVIAVSPKCGSSSFKQFFYMHEMENVQMIRRYEVNPNSEIYFVVRHPLDRFISLWKSKCRDRARIMDTSVYGMTQQELMDHILAGRRDVHWTPQTTLLGDVKATLIPLENLNQWWSDSGYGALCRFNSTDGEVMLSDELKNRILTFYADDVMLYDRAVEDYNLKLQ